MIRFILDTDIVSLLQDGNSTVVARVGSFPPDEIATTIITVEEQLSAWYTLLRKAKKTEQLVPVYQRMTNTVRFLSRLPLTTFNETAATTYDQLRKDYPRRGRMDMKIAAIALAHQATLVTETWATFKILRVSMWKTGVNDRSKIDGVECHLNH